MTFKDLLATNLDKILFDSTEFLVRTNLEHYHTLSPERVRAMLAKLYYHTRECVETNDMHPIAAYLEEIAPKRFALGYELFEVQTAINILEESLWKNIVDKVDAKERMNALLTSQQILCTAKSTLAKSYVELEKVEN